jgi:hypothetical protein
MIKGIVAMLMIAPPAWPAAMVVTDPVQTTLTKLQIAAQEKHNAFMKLQVIQDAKVLKDNFIASKAFYDQVEEHSNHRGGLMGYYKNMVEQQFDNVAQSQWRQFQDEATNATGDSAVNSFLQKMSAKISEAAGKGIDAAGNAVISPFNALDSGYSSVRTKLIHQQQLQVEAVDKRTGASDKIAEPIEKEIMDLVRRASMPAISTKESESIQMHALLAQLQLMAEMRQLLNINAQQFNAQAKKNLAEMLIAQKAANDLSAYKMDGAAHTTPSQDAIIREMKRRPGQ